MQTKNIVFILQKYFKKLQLVYYCLLHFRTRAPITLPISLTTSNVEINSIFLNFTCYYQRTWSFHIVFQNEALEVKKYYTLTNVENSTTTHG